MAARGKPKKRSPSEPWAPATEDGDDPASRYHRRHQLVGWWSLLVFLTLGAVLEMMHGFKVGWYLDVSNETRRLVWRLAHAHGALIGLLHIGFASSAHYLEAGGRRWFRFASPCLIAGGVLLPAGFLLGGFFVHGGDPGLGILLVPVGAALLFVAMLLSACSVTWRRR